MGTDCGPVAHSCVQQLQNVQKYCEEQNNTCRENRSEDGQEQVCNSQTPGVFRVYR
mgnify:FL=1